MVKNISLLNKNNIKSGKLDTLIPEFYDLKKVIENNDWHKKENVFSHTLSVLDKLDKIIAGLNKNNKKFLNIKIDNNTRKSLLKVAGIFHDIAKKETIIDKDGSTKCPNHEKRGAIKAGKILKRFNLSTKEIKFIARIIKNHGQTYKILALGDNNFRKNLARFKNNFKDIYLELILLVFADTSATKSRPPGFRSRASFYKEEIENI